MRLGDSNARLIPGVCAAAFFILKLADAVLDAPERITPRLTIGFFIATDPQVKGALWDREVGVLAGEVAPESVHAGVFRAGVAIVTVRIRKAKWRRGPSSATWIAIWSIDP